MPSIEQAVSGLKLKRYTRTWLVDIEALVRDLGIEIEEAPLAGPSGVLLRDGDACLVVLRKRDPSVRQRFTLAHELGHLRLEHSGAMFQCNLDKQEETPKYRLVEWQANRFAERVLMPAPMVRAFVETAGRWNLASLARAFGVCQATAYWRLVHLRMVQERLAI